MANPGPATNVTVNTESPRSTHQFIQTIGVTMTPAAVATVTAPEQSFGLNGATFATAATGILAGDVILAITPPSVTAGVTVGSARVDQTTNDKFYIQFVNPTAGSLTPPSGVWMVTVARFIQSATPTPGTLSTIPTSVALS
jgi:hypothetical protein